MNRVKWIDVVSRLLNFLTNPEHLRPRFSWLVLAALLLTACEEVHLTATPPSAQQRPPAARPVPVPPPAQATAPVEPVFAGPAGPSSGILRKPDAVTVAILLPLTGTAATFGRDLLAAAQMAVFDLADSNFELRLYDTGGQVDQARTAALAAQQDGAQIILGPLFSNAVLAAAAVAKPANIPILAFSNNREIVGDGVYAMGFVPEDQVQRIVDFSFRQNMTRFSALVPDDLYGSRMVAALNENAGLGGREITDVAYYQDETQALVDTVKQLGRYDERHLALLALRRELASRDDEISKRALRRLEGLETLGEVEFEALLLPAGGEEVLRIAPLLAFYDIDPSQIKLLGTWLWDDPALRTEPSMAGAWFAAPPAVTRQLFVERFKQLYERTPERRATLAYDATAL
ncbi:MAG: ABC-type branched-subunit amino acid transport system substrate-binding protein, partial [Alphaproteobacteria bacterium]